LNLEHVSAAGLLRQEISRRIPVGHQAALAFGQGKPVPDETVLAPLRRWFWTRKPDAGFVLADFPATLLQAQVFDDWLDARGVSLDAVLLPSAKTDGAVLPLLEHYHMQGVDVFDAFSLPS
jgi:adenylate kinase